MYGRAKNKAVSLYGQFAEFVDLVINDALAKFRALATTKTTADGFCAHPEGVCFNALFAQGRFNLLESETRRAIFVWTPVDEFNQHDVLHCD